MKTKNIITTGLMSAALLAAPLAKANSIGLEVIVNGSIIEYDDVQVSSTGLEFYANPSIDGWNIRISGQTYPAIGFGTLSSPILDVSTVDATATSAGTLRMIFVGTGYTGAGTAAMGLNGNLSAGSMSGVYSTYFNTANSLSVPVTGAEAGDTLIATSSWSGSPINVSGSGAVGSAGPYSLIQDITLTAGTGGGSISFDANLTSVPDGGLTLTMLGTALVGLAAVRSRIGRKH